MRRAASTARRRAMAGRRARPPPPRLNPPRAAGDRPGRRAQLAGARLVLARHWRAARFGGAHQRTAHGSEPVAELLRDDAGVERVADELRLDEDDELGAVLGARGLAEQITQVLDGAKPGDAGFRILLAL